VIWDTPTDFVQADGSVYHPLNYDNSWHGPMRLRMALANSLNIPAVKTLQFVGVDNFVEQAAQMGITTFTDPSRFGLAMALGSNEVRLLDLTNVYSTLRNGGREREPVAILQVTDSRGEVLERATPDPGRQVLGEHGEQIAFLLGDILSDDAARRYMFGPNNVMELPDGRPAAVKTGTSNEWRDSWAVGYTPDITIGVWVGNSDGQPMQEIAGSNGAGLIWRDLMTLYDDGRPIRQFDRPDGIDETPICADTGSLAVDACPHKQTEWFVAGTQPTVSDVKVVTVKVGGDGNCLAASYTPADQVRERTYAIYPDEFRDWARRAGIPQPPTDPCPQPQVGDAAVARITQPAGSGAITTTQVFVSGTARGSYVLEFGSGRDPTDWKPIVDGVADGDGLLGVWITTGLPNGDYTLRLRVSTTDGVAVEDRRTLPLRHS
jgi:membrane carboxypeptidase/penicillin-binding protein PbpC